VYVVIQPDTSEPVIMDGDDADSVCDQLNPTIMRRPLQLTAVPPDGTSWFGRLEDDQTNDPPMGACPYQGTVDPPPTLCDNQDSELSRVIPFGLDAMEPVIYGIGDLGQPKCTGDYWEIQMFAEQEGWLCMAGIATDNVGNTAVSRPLRVCYDDSRTSAQPACVNLQNPPVCTDGCTLPRRFLDLGDRILRTAP
jgi:hypothetical protein